MKIASIVLFSLCLSFGAFAAEVPPESELKSMTLDSLLSFNDGVQDKDFSDFYKELSALWKEQTTPAKLKELFSDFIEKEIDIAPIKKLQPVFNKDAKVNSDGMLVIAGYYPTTPKRVVFELKYSRKRATGSSPELTSRRSTRPRKPWPRQLPARIYREVFVLEIFGHALGPF